tara:strand:+ start:2951 stop:3613 length:663 start_codon:yes stop_codon:yes gene_type:complete
MRRQVYEWRNIMPVGEDNILNTLPILKPNNVHTIALGANIPIDIFIGGVGNNIDIPAELKATQYIVIDAIAVWPQNLAAQIYVNTSKYFQNPDRTPNEGITGKMVPFPNGNGGIINYDYDEGLSPPVYVMPNQIWGIEVTPLQDIPEYTGDGVTDETIAFCFVKYLLIDGADALIAKRLIDVGWKITSQNIQRYKQDLVRFNIIAGMAEMDELEGLERRV